jgi:hypothetical protein
MPTVTTTPLSTVWHHVLGTQPPPPWWLVLGTGLIALGVVAQGRAWRISRNVVTIAHEGGHALAALLTGRRLMGIQLHSDTSGVTVSAGKQSGFGMIVTTAAGYIAPPLLGLGAAATLAAAHVTALLWGGLLLLVLMMAMIRNVYGFVSIVVTGAVIFGVSWFASPAVQAALAYLLTWFLLLAGARPVLELQQRRRQGETDFSDADQLARLTGVPGLFWVIVFMVVALAALVMGAGWLMG